MLNAWRIGKLETRLAGVTARIDGLRRAFSESKAIPVRYLDESIDLMEQKAVLEHKIKMLAKPGKV